MKYLFIVFTLIISVNVDAQLDTVYNYCLQANVRAKVDNQIKSFVETTIRDNDTSLVRQVEVKGGLIQSEKFPGEAEWYSHYDKNDRFIKVNGFSLEENDTTFHEGNCTYDRKGRLISYSGEYFKNKKSTYSEFDTIIYFSEDSLKYIWHSYPSYMHWYKWKKNIKYRIVRDSLLNDKYVNNQLISIEDYSGDDVSFYQRFIYNEDGTLQLKFINQMDEYDFVTYEYDSYKKLVKETYYDGNNEIYKTKNILYNKEGLILKMIEDYFDGKINTIDYSYVYR